MRIHVIHLAFAGAIFATTVGTVCAGTTAYDVNVLLYQPHPLRTELASEDGSAPIPRNQLYPPARFPSSGAAPYSGRSAAAPSATDIRGPVVTTPGYLAQAEGGGWASGIVSEIRGGILWHDQGPFSRNEEDGLDVNLEVLFASPGILRFLWSPRPHVGANINTSGDTSQLYFGLSWEWEFWGGWFAGFSLGGAVHDGKLETTQVDRKELGCRLLFRESIEGGYRFNGKHSVSVYLDHISNANICDKNEGLENVGVRYGYRF